MSARTNASVADNETPLVASDIRIVPQTRSASFAVPVESDRERPRQLVAEVLTTKVKLLSGWPGNGSRITNPIELPRTLEAIDNATALLAAVRAELVEQGADDQ